MIRQKIVSLKEDGYYSNYTMVESTPWNPKSMSTRRTCRIVKTGEDVMPQEFKEQTLAGLLRDRSFSACIRAAGWSE